MTSVQCKLSAEGGPLGATCFVPGDIAIEGVKAEAHLLETDDCAFVHVAFTNQGVAAIELDRDDLVHYSQQVSGDSILSLNSVGSDVISELDPETMAAFTVARNLEDEVASLKGEGVENVVENVDGEEISNIICQGTARRARSVLSAGVSSPPTSRSGNTSQRSYCAEPCALPPLEKATFEQWLENQTSPKYTIMSLDPSVFDRDDVLPAVVLYAGIGGVTTGSVWQHEGKYIVTAVAVECGTAECATHRLNNPSTPVLNHYMSSHAQTIEAIYKFLPRRYMRFAWVHASNSCRKASTSNMFGRDIDAARADTVWAISLMEKLRPAIWTLENVVCLHDYFKGRYPTASIFTMHNHCALAQDRKRMIISNRPIYLPRTGDSLSLRQVIGERKGWKPGAALLTRNAWGYTRSVDSRSPTVTSGHLQAGSPTTGEFEARHILDSTDRALLQGFSRPPVFPRNTTECEKRRLVAQCVPPPFAEVLSHATFQYQLQALSSVKTQVKMAILSELYEPPEPVGAVADQAEALLQQVKLPADWKRNELFDSVSSRATCAAATSVFSAIETTNSASSRAELKGSIKRGRHGAWRSAGDFGWFKASQSEEHHIKLMKQMPWLICSRPPDPSESHKQFHAWRELEKLSGIRQQLERAEMEASDLDADFDARASRGGATADPRKSVAAQLSRHFINISPDPDALMRRDANFDKQRDDPVNYGPFLAEGEMYKTPRTEENLMAAYRDMGLEDLPEELIGEKQFYKDLVKELWVLFDGKLRPIAGVEIDLDLSGVKPIRAHPYRWSPAKVAAGKQLIQEFVDDGILRPITSEWASPALLVPKPKGGWRLVVDLRELNKLIPQDTYEPPGCDLCLEWLAGKPYRTTADMRWGFHQVLLSERAQRIFTLTTPFGTYGYRRLVMGYVNATAEFQRHMNNTLGPSLWDICLSMVDDLIVGSQTLAEHRVHVTQVFTKLAQRQHSIKPSKASFLKKDIEYLGHMSTPFGTRPTAKHVDAIVQMPAPLDDSGRVCKTKMRSFLGLAKYVRRYINTCSKWCHPLNQLTSDNSDGIWRPIHQMVFDRLKTEIAQSTGVFHPDFSKPLFLCSDASKLGIGGYIFQKGEKGDERIIAYFSRATTKEEKKWDTRELEVLALISTLEYFRHYIDGLAVHLSTDHKNITWISNLKGQSGRLGRWVLRLSEFNVVVGYKKGRLMYIADCMSRNPAPIPEGFSPEGIGEPTGISSRQRRMATDPAVADPNLSSWARDEGNAPAAAAVYGAPDIMITTLNQADCDATADGRPHSAALHMVEFCVPSQSERELEDEAAAQRDATARVRRDEAVSNAIGEGNFGDFAQGFSPSSPSTTPSASSTPAMSARFVDTPVPEHLFLAFAGIPPVSDYSEAEASTTAPDSAAAAAAKESLKSERAPTPSGEGLSRTSTGADARQPKPQQPLCNWTASECAAGTFNPEISLSERIRILRAQGVEYDEVAASHGLSRALWPPAARAAPAALDDASNREALQIPESLTPVPISTGQFKLEQAADPVCRQLIEELASLGDGARSVRLKKFSLIDGVLFRTTEADDPKEGYDSARIYVPQSLVSRVIRNHHSTVWGGHRSSTATFKEIVMNHYWPAMEKDIENFVRQCKLCELAKGTKPSRQGFLSGWRHSSVGQMICMDLIGPIGATNSGYLHHKQPFYVLVITDPFSHMVWLEPLVGKSSEELYEKFVNHYLLEEGAPLFILTDNGTEFKNSLLRDLMRLLKVRMHFTPSYHPRGNYTERVNRFVGESLRTMLASDGAKKHNWWRLLKFVQFAYRRMFIPGTNLSPYMVARGRQPSLPSDLERLQLGSALPTPPSLDDHVKQLQHHLAVATQLLRAARAEQLSKSRESFNQHQLEVKFQPGERVRLWKRIPIRHGANPDEISSKLKIFNHEYIIIGPVGDSTTRYSIRSAVSGQVTEAHVSQFARMRSAAHLEPEPIDSSQPSAGPSTKDVDGIYDRLQVGTYALIWRHEDPRSVLRIVEVLWSEGREYGGWYYIQGEAVRKGHYDAERAVATMRLIPEWVNKRTGSIERKPDLALQQKCDKVTEDFSEEDTELIVAGFPLYKGGKVPEYVAKKADTWLRRHVRDEPRILKTLSFPSPAEEARKAKLK